MFRGFPFGDFEGMGGMPGGMGGRREPKEIDNTTYYKNLGVEKDADFNTIKKAYFKLARQHHPDRGGDKEKFQEIQQAYEVLSDREKRETYDKYGEEGLKEGGGRGGDDIFSQMFGGMGGGRPGPSGPKKSKPVVHPLKCTLEEIYNGKSTKIAINRDRICEPCGGKGGKEGAVEKCTTCRGRGIVTRMTQLGPGMYSQSQGPCDDCGGKGEVIDEANKCKICNGKKTKKEKKIVDVAVDKGAPDGAKYTFHGEADQYPGQEPGDVIIVVKEVEHKKFKRRGADLFIEHKITLVEALTGINFIFTHLDGTQIRIKNEPGEVIKPDDIKTVAEKGFPFYKSPYRFGNLFIKFTVTFPDSIPVASLPALKGALPGPETPADATMDAETFMLQAFTEEQRNTKAAGGQQAGSDSEEEEGGHGQGQRVQCAQQ